MSLVSILKNRCTESKDLLGIAAMALVVWLACQAGVLAPLDNWLYDKSVAATTPISTRSDTHQVLLVYANRYAANADPERVLRTVNTLQQLGAKAVGVTFPVESLARERLYDPTSVIAGSGSHVSNDMIHPRDGINRWHVTAHADPLQNAPPRRTLEAALARIVRTSNGSFYPSNEKDIDFRVRFRGGPNSIPHVTDEDVLNHKLVRELIEGRTVLVGWAHSEAQPRLVTPTTSEIGMTTLEFRGHALETLLANDANKTPIWIWRLLLPVLLALVGYLVGQALIVRWTLAFAVVATVTFGGVAWILLVWQHLWIPAAPVAAPFFIALVLGSFARMKQKQVELRRSRTSQLASDLALAVQSTCSWQDIANMISQLVKWDRLVLLELAPGSDFLEVVHHGNCEATDIVERRRDVTRAPYQVASDVGDIISLQEREFLRSRAGEVQWMVPFLTDGQVVGFMVVSVDASRIENDPGLIDRLSHCARETAMVIARKQASQSGEFHANAESIEHDEASDAAIAVCDLFGRIEMMNGRMIDLCRSNRFDAGSQSLLQLMGQLLKGGEEKAREEIARVVMDGETVVCPVKSADGKGNRYLQLSPVANVADPFGVEVITLAVFDAPDFHGIQMQDEDLAEKVVQPAIQNAARVWAKSTDIPLEALPTAIAECTTASGSPDAAEDSADSADSIHPRDKGDESSLASLARTLLSHSDEIKNRRLNIEFVEPMADTVAGVTPELLNESFDLAVKLLLSRSKDGSLIRVESDACDTQLSIRIVSQDTPLNDKLRMPATDSSEFWNDLRALQGDLFASGSRIQVSARPGEQGVRLVFPVEMMDGHMNDSGDNSSLDNGLDSSAPIAIAAASQSPDKVVPLDSTGSTDSDQPSINGGENSVSVLTRTLLSHTDEIDNRRLDIEFVDPMADTVADVSPQLLEDSFDLAVKLLLSRSKDGSLIRVESDVCDKQLSIHIQSLDTPLTDKARMSATYSSEFWNDLRALQEDLFASGSRIQVTARPGEQGVSLVFPIEMMNGDAPLESLPVPAEEKTTAIQSPNNFALTESADSDQSRPNVQENSVSALSRTLLSHADEIENRRLNIEFAEPMADTVADVSPQLLEDSFDIAVKLLLSRSKDGSLIRVESDVCDKQLAIHIQSLDTPLTDKSRMPATYSSEFWNELRALQDDLFASGSRIQVTARPGEQSVSLVFPIENQAGKTDESNQTDSNADLNNSREVHS